MDKVRLDTLLVDRGYFETRQKAQAAVMAGLVSVGGRRVDKPGTRVAADADLQVKGDPYPYASRGGLKLEKALDFFRVDPAGKVALDAGASTGGFTDCLLTRGARLVYAVDVGYGQLAWRLRQDPRVVCLERTNLRYLEPGALGELPQLVTLDLSFISLDKVLPAVRRLAREGADLIALVKPQFEAGPGKVGSRGVVSDPGTHREVLQKVAEDFASSGFGTRGLTYSPVTGPEGNIEFLLYGVAGETAALRDEAIARVVDEAHERLTGG